MKLNTTRFGEIEVSENLLFDFVVPILGYDSQRQFVLIEHDGKSVFKWLQSVNDPSLAFAVTAAGFFGIDYVFELTDDTQVELGIESADDLIVLNIAIIPHDNPRKSTINLLAPLVFNVKNQKAAQVILTGSGFEVDAPLFNDKEQI